MKTLQRLHQNCSGGDGCSRGRGGGAQAGCWHRQRGGLGPGAVRLRRVRHTSLQVLHIPRRHREQVGFGLLIQALALTLMQVCKRRGQGDIGGGSQGGGGHVPDGCDQKGEAEEAHGSAANLQGELGGSPA